MLLTNSGVPSSASMTFFCMEALLADTGLHAPCSSLVPRVDFGGQAFFAWMTHRPPQLRLQQNGGNRFR